MSQELEKERVLLYQEELRAAQLHIDKLQNELEDVKRLLREYTYDSGVEKKKKKRKKKISVDDMFLLIDAIAESKALPNISLEEFFSIV